MLCNRCVSGYSTLGITAEKTSDELKCVYRELVKQWHPDRYESEACLRIVASQKLAAINAAYSHLFSCRNAGKGASAPLHQSSDFSHSYSVWEAGDFETFRSALCGTEQESRCTGRRRRSKFVWHKCKRCELLANASTAAQMLAGVAGVCFVFVLLCYVFPDAVSDITLWIASLEA